MSYQLTINGADKTSLLDSQSLVINIAERASCSFSLTTTANEMGNTDGSYVGQEIKFFENSTIIFGGIVKRVRIQRLTPKLGASATIRAYLTCTDYNDIPSRRVSSNFWQNKTGAELVQSYLNIMNTTGYNDNIGTGAIQTGANFITFESIAESIKESLDRIAEASGYKWYIDKERALNFENESTIVSATHDIVENGGFTDFNVTSIDISNENYRNKQWVVGETDITGELLVVSSESASEISSRATAESGSGVYGEIIRDTDAQTEADANIMAANGLKRYGKIPYVITFTTFTNDFNYGEKLKVNLPSMGIQDDMYFLIENVTVEDLGGTLRSTVYATRRNETDFSTQKTEDYKDYFAKLINNKGTKSTQKAITFTEIVNEEVKNLSTTPLELDGSNVLFGTDTKCKVDAQIDITTSGACTVTADVMVGSEIHTSTVKYYNGSLKDSFCVNALLKQVPNGSYTVFIRLTTSSGTATIDIEDYHLILTVRDGGIDEADPYPTANVVDEFGVSAIISDEVTRFSDTASSSLQLPDTNSIVETWDISSTINTIFNTYSDNVTEEVN